MQRVHPLGYLEHHWDPHPASRALQRPQGARTVLPWDLPSAPKVVGRAELRQGGKRTWVTTHLEFLINIFQLHLFGAPFPAGLVQASTKSPRQ